MNSPSYQGECEEIGYILGLWSEKFDKKVQFQIFLEKLGTYIVSNLKDGGDIQPLYVALTDPKDNFTSKYKTPKPRRFKIRFGIIYKIWNYESISYRGHDCPIR